MLPALSVTSLPPPAGDSSTRTFMVLVHPVQDEKRVQPGGDEKQVKRDNEPAEGGGEAELGTADVGGGGHFGSQDGWGAVLYIRQYGDDRQG